MVFIKKFQTKENTGNRLKLYNFDIEIGVPISDLSSKNVEKYFETIYFLMTQDSHNKNGNLVLLELGRLVIHC